MYCGLGVVLCFMVAKGLLLLAFRMFIKAIVYFNVKEYSRKAGRSYIQTYMDAHTKSIYIHTYVLYRHMAVNYLRECKQ